MDRAPVELDGRLAAHVPAGGGSEKDADDPAVRDRQRRHGYFEKPLPDPVEHHAGALAAGRREIQAARLVLRHLVSPALAQVGEPLAFPLAPVHFRDSRLARRVRDAEQSRGLHAAQERARDDAHASAGLRNRNGRPLQYGYIAPTLDAPLDAPRRVRVAQERQPRHRGASRLFRRLAPASRLRSAAMKAAALRPSAWRFCASSRSSRSGAAISSLARMPVRPSTTTSGTPRFATETTGRPAACASSIAMP